MAPNRRSAPGLPHQVALEATGMSYVGELAVISPRLFSAPALVDPGPCRYRDHEVDDPPVSQLKLAQDRPGCCRIARCKQPSRAASRSRHRKGRCSRGFLRLSRVSIDHGVRRAGIYPNGSFPMR